MVVRIKKAYIKLKLLLIRLRRVIRIMCPNTDIIICIILIVLWMIFGLFSNYVSFVHDGKIETYLRTMWDLRISVFSSIIISFAIGAIYRLRDYRKLLRRQHYLYVDSMTDFEELFRAIYMDDVWFKFHELYNDRCLEISMDYIESDISRINIQDNGFIMAIDIIQERLEKIDYQLKNNMLIVRDDEMMALEISNAKKNISQIIIEEKTDIIIALIYELFSIIEELRFLWRRDTRLDMQLLQMTDNPENDFYKRMWLPNFDIEMAKDW